MLLDGERAWPEPDSPLPAQPLPHAAQGRRPGARSCSAPAASPRRTSRPTRCARTRTRAAARSTRCARSRGGCATQPREELPELLLLLGDQVYADEVSPHAKAVVETRRDPREEPGDRVVDYEEYTHLYRESWTEPTIRWLLSTVSTAMIFDDHDIHDDWNVSARWVDEMRAEGVVERAHRRRADVVLGLPAPRQRLRRPDHADDDLLAQASRRPTTPASCCASSRAAPTARPTARAGATAATSAARGW